LCAAAVRARRRHNVTITASRKGRLAEAGQAFGDAEDAFLAPLTEEQREHLRDLLLALRGARRAPVDDC
jgi:hypothetical protein